MNVAAAQQAPIQPKKARATRRIIALVGGVVLLLLVLLVAVGWYMSYVPDGLDYSTTRVTDNGHYQVSYEPSASPIPINELHTWTLTVTTPGGEPVEHATITLDGDMPQHGHGLPTQPQVTQNLGEGRYLIEGVKFQMGGWWVMEFEVTAHDNVDQVRFNFILH